MHYSRPIKAETRPNPVPTRLRGLGLALSALSLCLPMLLITGCDAIAAISYVVAPRPLHEAVYELPDKKTVIFVEDRDNVAGDPSLARNIAANVEKWLVDEQRLVEGTVVGPEDLESYLASLGDERESVRLSAIAAHFQANQLIYIKIDEFQMAVGAGVYRPQVLTQVKVIDMDSRRRVMPQERDPETGIQTNLEFYPVLSKLPAINRSAEGQNAQTIATQQLAMQAGEDIAKLFFDWREAEPGEKLERK